ncbi:hypothetical protein [Pelagibaculum spongiae]|uniref:NHLP bacteriocin system secretion protein n=1 Tax=Pelagibaculum spongiae TaxID=2080658 RepID=A0A2V1GYV5_9GAMM|nr:hypothetical protein [Pelagibaculum spongiae]PVZ72234.1 hypothetical protein DC094_04265 [Pelagibaculum spongiae]
MSRLFRKSFLLQRKQNQESQLSLLIPLRNESVFWPFLFSSSFFLFALTAWLFLSELPIEVEATGMVLPLGGVREINAFSEGVVTSRQGDPQRVIEAGDILLELSPLGADENFLQARRSYLENKKALVHRQLNATASQNRTLDTIALQISNIERSKKSLADLKDTLIAAADVFSKRQKQSLADQGKVLNKLMTAYQSFLFDLDKLKKSNLVNQQEYLDGLQQHSVTLQSFSELSLRSPRSSLDRQRLKKDIYDLQMLIAEQDVKLIELNHKIEETREAFLAGKDELNLEELKYRQTLLQKERDLWRGSRIIAPYSGELLAVNKTIGQGVVRGESVALLGMVDQDVRQMLVISPRAVAGNMKFSYFSQQKKITLDANFTKSAYQFVYQVQRIVADLIDVEPNLISVKQKGDRFVISLNDGSDRIKYLKLVDFDLLDIEKAPVFSSLQIIGDQWKTSELVNIALVASDQAKRITPGNGVLVKPDYVKTLAGAQLKASVRQLSKLITTSIEAEALIGTSELAQKIAGEQSGVAVIIDLKKDENGRYQWDGKPPDIPLAIGSTTKSKIRVGSVPPIEVILPLITRYFE